MNAGRYRGLIQLALVLAVARTAAGDSARVATSQGNKLYGQGNFNEAINKYDQALVESPEALRPKFNKANSYYRLDDLSKAMDLYREVAAESKDMGLVARAKYNLGNSYFQQGVKQRDSDLRKAIDDLKTAIGSWRGTLDIEAGNKKAAKNIEVARLIIKDIMDQLKNQQDPNQPQDPNQAQQQQQNQQQQGSPQDPNQPQEQDSQQDPNEPQDPNQAQEQQQPQEEKDQQQQTAPDATAQEILDREQQQRRNRQRAQRSQWRKVEKDW